MLSVAFALSALRAEWEVIVFRVSWRLYFCIFAMYLVRVFSSCFNSLSFEHIGSACIFACSCNFTTLNKRCGHNSDNSV